ncbi:GlcG/HbpS family heme-binding protein [Paraburkholderia sp. J94]|uniref:GlcG/HbpS family heme-binding protein n=2 Tax=unclassified Paraburkholderia TaxID=2615204 RepID=UPI002AB159A7|nr:heme-binding protein [Paraburkholderia sp. J94]
MITGDSLMKSAVAALLVALSSADVTVMAAPANAPDSVWVSTQPTLSSAAARKLLAQAIEMGDKRGYRLCVAIADASGNLLDFDRHDGAHPGCVDAAIAKAKSAASNGVDTEVLLKLAHDTNPGIGAIPGIVPAVAGDVLRYRGVVIGAIGIAGGPNDAEETRFAGELRRLLEQWLD